MHMNRKPVSRTLAVSLSVVCALLVASLTDRDAHALTAGTAQPPPPTFKELVAFEESLKQSSSAAEREIILAALEARAREAHGHALPDSGMMMLLSAKALLRYGKREAGLDMMDEVIHSPESLAVEASALNLRAFYTPPTETGPNAANTYHFQLLDLIDDAGPQAFTEGRANRLSLGSASQLASSYRLARDPEERRRIVEVVDQALATAWLTDGDHVSGGQLYKNLLRAALAMYTHAGEPAKAEQVKQKLDARHPGWGDEDGAHIVYRLREARNNRPLQTDDPDVIEDLLVLWSDADTREHPMGMTVASNLASALRHAESSDALAIVAIDASMHYLEMEESWNDDPQGVRVFLVAGAERIASQLMYEAVATPHWRDHAVELLFIADAFLERFDDHHLADAVERQRDLINHYLSTQ